MKRNINKSNLIVKWIISYILIIAIFTSAMIIGFVGYEKTYNHQALTFNNYVISNMTRNVQNTMISIRQLYTNISFHKDIAAVASVSDINGYFKNPAVFQFMSDISNYYFFKNNISFFYIYDKNTDCVLSKTGIIDSKFFYNTYFKNNASYEEWKKEIANTSSGNFSPVIFTENGLDYDAIAYNISISEEPNLSISIIIDRNVFFRDVEEIKWTGLCDIFIFDSRGKLSLYNSRSNGYIPKHIDEIPEEDKDRFVITNHITFDTVNLTVVAVAPKKVLKKHILYMRLFSVLIILLSILIAIAMSLRFSKQHYKPVKSILNLFKINDNKNEYVNINNHIKTILSENNMVTTQLKKQNQSLRSWHLSRILKGSPFSEYTTETASKYDICFKDGVYGFIVFNIQKVDEFYTDYTSLSIEEKYNELKFIISNIFEELFNTPTSVGYVLDVDHLLGCVINIFNTEDSNYEFITNKLEYGLDFIKKHFALDITYVMSALHNSIQALPTAYSEASQLISYKSIMNISDSLMYCNVQPPTQVNNWFSFETKRELVNYIEIGDVANATILINQIFETIQNNTEIAFMYAKSIVYDVAATLLKLSVHSSYALQELLYVFSDSTSMLDYSIKNHILNAVNELCKNTSYTSQDNHTNKIIEYVYVNYSDVGLNVASISDHYGLTPSYISKIFKSTYGESLMDFINKYRLEKAKELIKTGKYTFAEISNMVGYNHIRTFNRIFKKYEKTTPSSYRNSKL